MSIVLSRDQQRNGVHFNRTSFPHCINLFMRLAFDIHARPIAVQMLGDVGCHCCLVRPKLWALAYHCDVKVADREASRSHSPCGLAEKDRRIGAVILRIVVGKELTNIRITDGPENRISDSVIDGIAIGMADRTRRVILESHAAKHKQSAVAFGRACLQSMQVITVAYSHSRISIIVKGFACKLHWRSRTQDEAVSRKIARTTTINPA